MADAIRSIPECADSLSIPNEPVRMPVISLRAVTAPAARTEKTAAERLACGAPDCGGVAVLSVVAVGIAAMAPMLQLGRRHCIARHRVELSLKQLGVRGSQMDGVVLPAFESHGHVPYEGSRSAPGATEDVVVARWNVRMDRSRAVGIEGGGADEVWLHLLRRGRAAGWRRTIADISRERLAGSRAVGNGCAFPAQRVVITVGHQLYHCSGE